jgi:uncharacterized protein YegP (UPF0339 family)
MAGTYLLQRGGNSQFIWNLRAANNEKILTSELYNTKAAALNGIDSCRLNSPIDARYHRLENKGGAPYFTLRAANNEVIGTSESYSSTTARENGITSCKTNGPIATTVDQT